MSKFIIKRDDLTSIQVIELLEEHLADMQATSPPESKHALDIEALRAPHIKFWTLWDGNTIAGCGAYQSLDDKHAEIKSMRTAKNYKKQGVASLVLQHIITDAKADGYEQLSLETGAMDYFMPARKMYEKFGFDYCLPFADYIEDENSKFMTLHLN